MIKVRVPATSANMGPGFDTMGVALSLYNVYGFKEIDSGLKFNGFLNEFSNENNIIYKSMQFCFTKGGYKIKGLEISLIEQNVPISRGLGSSSTCIVAGLMAANKIMNNKFSREELLNFAVEIEGHPDNVAPALLGGIIVATTEKGDTIFQKIIPKNEYRFVPVIPDFKLSTEDARNVLPKELKYKDAIYNISRAALMVAALVNGDDKILKYACNDNIHQKYRSKLIKGFDLIVEEAYNNGALASFLSGAGPTIMALIRLEDDNFSNKIRKVLDRENLSWDILELSIDNQGAMIIEGGN